MLTYQENKIIDGVLTVTRDGIFIGHTEDIGSAFGYFPKGSNKPIFLADTLDRLKQQMDTANPPKKRR